MAREGKLPAARVGRKWLFPAEALERLLGAREANSAARPRAGRAREAQHGPRGFEISARNRLRGRIARLRIDGLMAEVVLRIGDQDLVAIITRDSAERMGLKPGDDAVAVIKSTEVMLGKEGREA
jgi:molybdopterin-binding protein